MSSLFIFILWSKNRGKYFCSSFTFCAFLESVYFNIEDGWFNDYKHTYTQAEEKKI